ncbi:MAG: hypothetical protein HRU18_12110 [Pseudoalteromonas sp.]|uniref:hypothetical protein n=1 Tax=Pseudoalteromonas sp. TaxID=53249 RepID=UPI001D23B549|nr:hypothetical protein [Pseudoalteromonas sp.]NRA78946.1 hypothetical protein [Pseudoalteromonas sp.]
MKFPLFFKTMAEKKILSNKAEKKPIAKKASAKKSIDWDSMPEMVVIVGKGGKHLEKGREYNVTKETAKVLVEKGVADCK